MELSRAKVILVFLFLIEFTSGISVLKNLVFFKLGSYDRKNS